ncbi:hypothetical protein [Clostridium sardiniense]|uniref:hypothetical protein n=1 Tax=Clostridium sardiniense TaxID=29369 RepID=UPI003D33AE83
MKILNRKIFIIIGAIVLSLAFVGCGNDMVTKSLNEAKQDINNKDYAKAMDALQIVIDQDSNNKEANDLMQILGNYNGAVIHYKDKEYKAAEKELNEITADYSNLAIKGDIDELKSEIAFQESKTKVVDEYINKATTLVKQKKYKEAEAEIKKIDVNSPSKKQLEKINTLNKTIKENMN